jgi:hypothetical protein
MAKNFVILAKIFLTWTIHFSPVCATSAPRLRRAGRAGNDAAITPVGGFAYPV